MGRRRKYFEDTQFYHPSKSRNSADDLVRRAISDARVVGSVFVLFGLFFSAIVLLSSRGKPDLGDMLLMFAGSLILLGPGVLYHVAAYLLTKREAWAIRLCLYGCCAHLALVVLFFALGIARPFGARMLLVPAVMCLFQIPAIVAFIVHTYLARRAADQAGNLPAFTPVLHHQGIDSDRPK